MTNQSELNLNLTDSREIGSIEDYQFSPNPNPIKGYPELHWQGKRPFTSTVYSGVWTNLDSTSN